MNHVRWTFWLFSLLGLLVAVMMLSLSVGAAGIPVTKIIPVFLEGRGSAEYSILFDIRLMRIILGFAIGGSLSLAGVILQGLFRNPLVEPYTLGISGGAALGVAINVALGLAVSGRITGPLAGVLGAGLVLVFLYFSNLRMGVIKLQGLLLNGVMISFICSSLVMLLMALSSRESLQGIIFWIMGCLGESEVSLIWSMFIAAWVLLVAAYFFCLPLNALALGEEEAQHLGVPVECTKRSLFFLAAVLTGFCVAVAGMIGFVGLVVPHLMRRLVGHDHRILLGASFLAGAIFLIFCDMLARTIIAPLELPVGVITGIVGGSLFVYALSRGEVDHA
ncbi:MAG: iron ABC transporter permease [Candidatus Omnitrophica bacterium]|nr:iron ABC transporter permease [Candidatus Omnitrophota bacterium]